MGFLYSARHAETLVNQKGDPLMTEHVKLYPFFVDAKRYETDHKSLTGAAIKNLAGVPATY